MDLGTKAMEPSTSPQRTLDLTRDISVSRRGFVWGAGIGGIIAFNGVDLPSAHADPTAAPPDEGSPQIDSVTSATTVQTQTFDVFCDSWTRMATVAFPISLLVSVPTPATLEVSWDPRVIALGDTTYGSTSSGVLERMQPGALADGFASFALPRGLERIVLPAVAQADYPLDLVEEPLATTCRLITSEPDEVLDFPIEFSEVRAWGAEVLPLWSQIQGVVYPAGIQILSVGPGTTPPTLTLDVSLDERVVSRLTMSEGMERSKGGQGRTHFRAEIGALPPGQTHEFTVGAPDSGDDRALRNPLVPYISIDSAVEDRRGGRNTGKTFVLPLLPSGGELSSYEEYESA